MAENKIGIKCLGKIYLQKYKQIKALLYKAVGLVACNLCCVQFLINLV